MQYSHDTQLKLVACMRDWLANFNLACPLFDFSSALLNPMCCLSNVVIVHFLGFPVEDAILSRVVGGTFEHLF